MNKYCKIVISMVFIASVNILGQSPSLAEDKMKWFEAYPEADEAFTKGYEAFKKGDFTTALTFFQPLAEKGDASVQSILGNMYRRGEGVPQAPPHLLMMPAKIVLILNQSDFDGGGGLMLTWQGFAFVPRPQILKAEREYQPRSLAPAGPMQACG
ncbi:MAG: hypothetical protein ACKOBC_07245 [Hyphomicrobiales bacterium]